MADVGFRSLSTYLPSVVAAIVYPPKLDQSTGPVVAPSKTSPTLAAGTSSVIGAMNNLPVGVSA